jgi:hypothetical protein
MAGSTRRGKDNRGPITHNSWFDAIVRIYIKMVDIGEAMDQRTHFTIMAILTTDGLVRGGCNNSGDAGSPAIPSLIYATATIGIMAIITCPDTILGVIASRGANPVMFIQDIGPVSQKATVVVMTVPTRLIRKGIWHIKCRIVVHLIDAGRRKKVGMMDMSLEITGMAGYTGTAAIGAAVVASAEWHSGGYSNWTSQLNEIIRARINIVTGITGIMDHVTGSGSDINRRIVWS